MAGISGYPASIDDFSTVSPTNLGDDDSTGRNHAERHDDMEAAMEAVQGELGTDPAGSASTVAARFTALDTTVDGKIAASIVTAADDLLIGAGAGSVTNLAAGSVGYVLTSGSAGLTWAEAAGGATVEMSDTEPVDPDNGTLWVDTDSSVATFNASAYIPFSIADAKGDLIAASADNSFVRLPIGTEGYRLQSASTETTGMAWSPDPVTIGVACSDETTDLATGTSVVTFRMPHAMTLTEVRATVTTAPVGSTIIVDINESGASVLSTELSIDASEKTSTTAATPAVISDSTLADDAEITIDIDQVGSSTAGTGLKVWLIGTR